MAPGLVDVEVDLEAAVAVGQQLGDSVVDAGAELGELVRVVGHASPWTVGLS